MKEEALRKLLEDMSLEERCTSWCNIRGQIMQRMRL